MWKNIFIDNNVMHRKINSLKTITIKSYHNSEQQNRTKYATVPEMTQVMTMQTISVIQRLSLKWKDYLLYYCTENFQNL